MQLKPTYFSYYLIALGWKREICRFRNYGRRCVYYVSPCGRRLRDFGEVHRCVELIKMYFFQCGYNF